MENKQLKNLKNPTDAQDACTKSYADQTKPITQVPLICKTTIINLSNPSNNKDVVNKQYIDSKLQTKLDSTRFNDEMAKKADKDSVMLLDERQAMTGDIDLGNNKAINSAAPTNDKDVVNKKYLENNYIVENSSSKFDLKCKEAVNSSAADATQTYR